MEDFRNESVLVTGVGGITGQGILQCLLKIKSRPKIIATDISKTAAGLFWADEAFVLPHSSAMKTYLEKIRFLCKKHNVSVVFPGSDGESRILTYNADWKSNKNILLAASNKNVWNITGNKLNTYVMAKKLNVLTPVTKPFSILNFNQIAEDHGLPVVLKPRAGSGSRGIYYIRKSADIPEGINLDEYLLQEFVGNESSEYTVGAFFAKESSNNRLSSLVALQRTLLHGNTSYGEIISPQSFEEDITKIANYLALTGYCNFQFISKKERNYLIEINARFSSSISISQKAGCNFVELYLLDNLKNKLKPIFRSKPGKTVIRYMNDYVVETSKVKVVTNLGSVIESTTL